MINYEDWERQPEDLYCLYIHIRLDTGKVFYVGVTGQKTMKRAHNIHCRSKFWKYIYAKTKIEVEIPYRNMTRDSAYALEIKLIAHYRRTKDGGTLCNISAGGAGGKPGTLTSDELRELRRNLFLGKKRPASVGEKIRAAKLGRKLPQEWRDKIGAAGLGRKMSEESKEIMRLKKLYNKPVAMYDLNNNEIGRYRSIKEAEKQTGISKASIKHNANNPEGKKLKFIWKFI